MKKRLISVLLAAVMCTSLLAGCGKGSEDPESTPTPAPTSATPDPNKGQNDNQGNSGEVTPSVPEVQGWSYQNVDKLDNPNVTIALYWAADEVV